MNIKVDFTRAILRRDTDGNCELALCIDKEFYNAGKALCGGVQANKTYTGVFTEKSKVRSLDANGYCWVLCQKIAEKIGSKKELVYQEIIRDVGQFEIIPTRSDAVEYSIARWNSMGLGWYASVIEDSKLPGYKKVIRYFGSSTYTVQEMSVLINEIVTQAKELGIETATPDELAKMMDRWGKKEDKDA